MFAVDLAVVAAVAAAIEVVAAEVAVAVIAVDAAPGRSSSRHAAIQSAKQTEKQNPHDKKKNMEKGSHRPDKIFEERNPPCRYITEYGTRVRYNMEYGTNHNVRDGTRTHRADTVRSTKAIAGTRCSTESTAGYERQTGTRTGSVKRETGGGDKAGGTKRGDQNKNASR